MRTWRLAPLFLTVLTLVSAGVASAAPNTEVRYKLYHFEGGNWVRYTQGDAFPAGGDQPGTNMWKYDYSVKNVSYAGTGINTWYAFFNSDNILCATHVGGTAPASWTAVPLGPVLPNNNWRERFRTTVTGSFITQGNTQSGYTVEFTWTCPTLPGNQHYDAVTSGGSEASVTTEEPEDPVPNRIVTWGNLKAIYR